jgi:hypothetical protein
MTAAPDPNYRHQRCYGNLHGGCSTKVSGEHYISHSLIELYTFDDPKVALKHNNGSASSIRSSPRILWRRCCAPTATTTSITANRPGWQRACYKLIGAAASVFVVPNYTAPPHPPGGAALHLENGRPKHRLRAIRRGRGRRLRPAIQSNSILGARADRTGPKRLDTWSTTTKPDRFGYGMMSGLSSRMAATVSRSRLSVAATTSAGVRPSHWFSDTSAKRSLRNSSSIRTGPSPTFSM